MRRLLIVVAGFVVALFASTIVAAVQQASPEEPVPLSTPVSSGCQVRTADGEVALSIEQMANAATIAAVGLVRKLPDRAVAVALATALQESHLRNVKYGDRDSLGLFQQRPSQGWGTPEQVMDPRHAAGRFYSALVRVHNWEELRITEAAQRVQRSAYPEAYEKWAQWSTVLAEALAGRAAGAVSCAQSDDPVQVGRTAVEALDAGLRLDWGDTVTVQDAGDTALALAAGDAESGWRYAHWIVAHSADTGVARVRYLDHEWTGDGQGWRAAETANGQIIAGQVIAEVFTDH